MKASLFLAMTIPLIYCAPEPVKVREATEDAFHKVGNTEAGDDRDAEDAKDVQDAAILVGNRGAKDDRTADDADPSECWITSGDGNFDYFARITVKKVFDLFDDNAQRADQIFNRYSGAGKKIKFVLILPDSAGFSWQGTMDFSCVTYKGYDNLILW